MQTSAVIPAEPKAAPVSVLNAIQNEGWRLESGKGVDINLPSQVEALAERLVSGARGDAGRGNDERLRTKRVTFFRNPERNAVLGLGTYRNCRGQVMVVAPNDAGAKSIPLLKVLQLGYVPVASVRLRSAHRGFRLVCTPPQFKQFILDALQGYKCHFGGVERSREAFLDHCEWAADPEECEAEPDGTVNPAFVYAVFDRIERINSQGDVEESDLSLDIVARALVSLRSETPGLKLLRENLRGRSAAWLEALREAALQSYEASKQIQDPLRRADAFRRHVERAMGRGVPEQPMEQRGFGPVEPELTWTPPVETAKTPTAPRSPSRAELRRRAAAALAASQEYKAWQAARSKGPVVTQVGSAQFLAFWSPFIAAVEDRLRQILAKIPVRGPVLGFLPA